MSTLRVDTLETTDSTTTVQVKDLLTADNLVNQFVSVKDFGAVGDGTTDDTAAIKSAITSGIGTRFYLYFPPGNYVVSSRIDVPLGNATQLHLQGAGAALTSIKLTGATQSFLSVTGNSGNWWLDAGVPNGSFQLSEMTIANWGGIANTGVAISFDMGAVEGRPNKGIRIRNVVFKCEGGYHERTISIANSHQIEMTGCIFYSQNNIKGGIGIYGKCDEGKDGGGMHITDCEFYFFQYGIYTSDHFEGTYVTSCAFVNCSYGFIAVEAGAESGVLITNSEFDCWEQGIHLDGMFDFVITGNCFLFPSNTVEQRAISVTRGSGFTITGNKIQGSNSSSSAGIVLANTDDSLGRASYVGGNAIGGWNTAMVMQSCSNITFGSWAWKDCTLDTNVSGTNTYIKQGCYEKNQTLTQTLATSSTTWTITIDISDMRLTRTPAFADLVSQSADNMIARYVYASSSATSVVFNVTLGNLSSISAGTYRFGLSVKSPYFSI